MKNQEHEKWVRFANRVIETGGNPSVKDATGCGIPVWCFNEICMRNLSNEQMIQNAKKVICNYAK